MAILRFLISPSEPCIFAIFKPTNFKFWIENYITKNDTSGFFDKLSISSAIELQLGPSRIKGFFYFLRHFVFFALIYFFYFFLYFQSPKYIIKFTLNSISRCNEMKCDEIQKKP
jgi:hypothetical protein